LRSPRAALLAALLVALALPASAGAQELEQPRSHTVAPPGFRLSAERAVAIAARGEKVRTERSRHRRFEPTAYTRGPGRWQVSWFAGEDEVAQVRLDDGSGAILEQWTGDQVAWTMARGYEGAFGHTLNAPYVWLPLCLLFLAPFFDPRRPLRVLHLDLLVLLGFGLSHVFFNRGEIGVSAPLVYPFLLYLLGRLLWVGLRRRRSPQRATGERLIPVVPLAWLVVALVLLVSFRVVLNVVDSSVIDVGLAGVVGADRIADGDRLYGPDFSDEVDRGDTYGPLAYLAYVPFEQALPWSGAWDDLPAAHGAALAFDLGTLLGLILLGHRLGPRGPPRGGGATPGEGGAGTPRGGASGRELGIALGYAWASYPYALFALQTNSNDGLVALTCVLALLALTVGPGRRGVAAVARAGAVAFAAATKLAPLALAPLFASAPVWNGAATPGRERPGPTRRARLREALLFGSALAVLLAVLVLPFVPPGGLAELYDRTLGYQASRPSPFSLWGQVEGLDGVQVAVRIAAGALAVAVAFVRRRDVFQTAALAGAVLIAVQLGATHWFYLYIAWFAPFALVALLGSCDGAQDEDEPDPPARDASAAPASAGRRQPVVA
jgi:hypothetical protein